MSGLNAAYEQKQVAASFSQGVSTQDLLSRTLSGAEIERLRQGDPTLEQELANKIKQERLFAKQAEARALQARAESAADGMWHNPMSLRELQKLLEATDREETGQSTQGQGVIKR